MSKDTHLPPMHWKSYAGLRDIDEYYAQIAEKKMNKKIKQKYFQSLFSGASNPKRKKSSPSEEEQDIPDLDLETEEPEKSTAASNESIPSSAPSTSQQQQSSLPSNRLVDQQYEKRIAELEGANARLKYRQEQLLKENARMSSSYEKIKSIRMLLVAKVKVANPEENEEDLFKLSLGQLVCRYEATVVPLTSSSSNKEVERLTKKVEKLEAKKKSLKEKLVAAKTVNDMQSLKEDIIKAVNKDGVDIKKAQEEIASLKETIVELKTKKRLQYELNAAQQNQELELKKVLKMPENSPMYLIVEKVKELKETVSRLYDYEENEGSLMSIANETINQHFVNTSRN